MYSKDELYRVSSGLNFIECYTDDGLWTTVDSRAMPYQSLDGTWKINFLIEGFVSVGTNTLNLKVRDVTFCRGMNQSITAYQTDSTSAYTNYAYALKNTNTLKVVVSSAQLNFVIQGDVIVEEKPVWLVDQVLQLPKPIVD